MTDEPPQQSPGFPAASAHAAPEPKPDRAAEELEPPWARLPELSWGSPGWRMGGGEEYRRRWSAFISERFPGRDGLLPYLIRHPPATHRWRRFLLRELQNLMRPPPVAGDTDRFWHALHKASNLTEGLQVMRRWQLLGDDVAYPTFVRNALAKGGLTPPWKWPIGGEGPEKALRYNARQLGWWARWLGTECTDVQGYLDAPAPTDPWGGVVARIRLRRDDAWETCQGGASSFLTTMVARGTLPPPWTGGHPPLLRPVSWDLDGDGANKVAPDDRDRWVWWVIEAFDDPASWRAYLARWPAPEAWKETLDGELFRDIERA